MRFTRKELKQVEELFKKSGFGIRYGQGNFKAGHCLLNDRKIIVVNKFFDVEARLTCLLELLELVNFDLLSVEEIKFLESYKKKVA